MGPTGPTGATGPTGPTGPSGASGLPGASGTPALDLRFSYLGCYADMLGTLYSTAPAKQTDALNSPDRCATFCAGYFYMAVNGQQCACATGFFSLSAQPGNPSCNTPCPGNAGVNCGGTGPFTLSGVVPIQLALDYSVFQAQ